MHIHPCISRLDLHLLVVLSFKTPLSCARVGLRPPSLLAILLLLVPILLLLVPILLLLLLISDSFNLVLISFFFSLCHCSTLTHTSISVRVKSNAWMPISISEWLYLYSISNFFSKLQCGLNTDDLSLLGYSLLKWWVNLSWHPHLCCALLWLLKNEEFFAKYGNLFGDLRYSLTRIRRNWSILLKIVGILIQEVTRILHDLEDLLGNFHFLVSNHLICMFITVFLD
jgi:hypothetical protein